MSATPTLYTYEYSDYVREYVPREAKHDQLIAAMPRCVTCKERKFCTLMIASGKEDYEFGCTDHKERT